MKKTLFSRSSRALFLASFAIAGATSFFLHPTPASATPNIVLINVDNLGAGDVCYAGDSADPRTQKNTKLCNDTNLQTPRLDQLAKDGVTLNNFYSVSPLCTPSRAALMTGRDPQRYGATYALDSTHFVPKEEKTLAKLLWEAEYNTGIVGKWNLGMSSGLYSWDQNFEYNYVLPEGVSYNHTGFCFAKKSGVADPEWNYVNGIYDVPIDNYVQDCANATAVDYVNWVNTEQPSNPNASLTEVLTEKAVAYINDEGNVRTNGNPPKPYFLYVAWPAAHSQVYIHLPKDRFYVNQDMQTDCPVDDTYLDQDGNEQAICTQSECDSGLCTPKHVQQVCQTICSVETEPNTHSQCMNNCDLAFLYSYAVKEIDRNVGRILDAIGSSDTIVMFTSDNGAYTGYWAEYTNPARSYKYDRKGNTGGMRGGQQFTYEGGVRVPFIAKYGTSWGDGNTTTYTRKNQIADMMDIAPTLISQALGANSVTNGANAADNTRIKVSGKTANYEVAVDGKDISTALTGTADNTTLKNEQVSFLAQKEVCKMFVADDYTYWPASYESVNWLRPFGYCNTFGDWPRVEEGTAEEAWKYGVRSNASINPGGGNPLIDPSSYKLYFRDRSTGPANKNWEDKIPHELYAVSADPARGIDANPPEDESANLCFEGSVDKCESCTFDGVATYSCPGFTDPARKIIVEKLWQRGNLYQNKVNLKLCDGSLYPNGCPLSTLNPWSNFYSGNPNNNGDTINMGSPFAVGNGSKRLLMVAVVMELDSSNLVSSLAVTYGETPMTLIKDTKTTKNAEHAWMGYLLDTQIGTGEKQLAISYNTGGNHKVKGLHVKWGSYSGVNQTTPINITTTPPVNPVSKAGKIKSITFGTALSYVTNGRTIVVSGNAEEKTVAPFITSTMNHTDFGTAKTNAHFSGAGQTSDIYETNNHVTAGSYSNATAVTWTGTVDLYSALVAVEIKP